MFEEAVVDFLRATFLRLSHIRPGKWIIEKGQGSNSIIANFEQYQHLFYLEKALQDKQLRAALGCDYIVKPDVIIAREPEPDEAINVSGQLVDDGSARLAPLRKRNSVLALMHASISCKWTIRSDRVQNARTEALNLVRNRKGRVPHVVVITAEPMPSRLAAIALGTGDVDCTYHIALPELALAINRLTYEDASDALDTMIKGKRLRDISDLPLDLAV